MKHNKINYLSSIIVFVLAILYLGCGFSNAQENASPQLSAGNPETPFVSVEEMPVFTGGEQAMFDFIKNNLVYPTYEKNAGMEGTVYVYFVINKQGKVVNAEVRRGVKGGDGFNKEAIRVVECMPSWSIGKQNGQPEAVQFIIPVKFQLH